MRRTYRRNGWGSAFVLSVSAMLLSPTFARAQYGVTDPAPGVMHAGDDPTKKPADKPKPADKMMPRHTRAEWTVGGWGAFAKKQMIKTRLGRKYDRDLYLMGIRATRPVVKRSAFALDYSVDVVPVLLATGNREYDKEVQQCPVPGHPACAQYYPRTILHPSERTAYGFGFTPVGLRARYKVYGPLQAAVGLTGGAAYFDRRIPDPEETRFNFTADGNVGLMIRTRIGSLSGGVKWHHISNGNTGRVNPAIDSRMWFFGFER